MPELPEVHTTAMMLDKMIVGRKIIDVWTDYNSPYYAGKNQVKNPEYFKKFKKSVSGAKFVGASRRAKNVLIHLDNDLTILVHMKMTGHLLYGEYEKKKPTVIGTIPAKNDRQPNLAVFESETWRPQNENALADPWNRWIHLVFILDNGHHLALSDLRKFAKVTLIDSKNMEGSDDLIGLGPEPLDKNVKIKNFEDCLNKKPNGKIKSVIMDPSVVVGVGNIYSDEALWMTELHPETPVKNVPKEKISELFKNIKEILKKGLRFGGSSESDYRMPDGTSGSFQTKYKAYKQTGKECQRDNCSGKITRIIVGGRSAHFCNLCQKKS